MAHFLPPELVRQVNKLEWPYLFDTSIYAIFKESLCVEHYSLLCTAQIGGRGQEVGAATR